MADTKSKFNLHPYEPADRPGHYDEEVQALIEAGPGIAITVQVPVKSEDEYDKELAKHKRWFQESAKRYGKTAKLTEQADQQDGSIHLDFILMDKITRARKAKPATPADDSDTPEESAA